MLEGRFVEGRALQEIAEELGVTRERIRQIEQKALKRLRKSLTLLLPDRALDSAEISSCARYGRPRRTLSGKVAPPPESP